MAERAAPLRTSNRPAERNGQNSRPFNILEFEFWYGDNSQVLNLYKPQTFTRKEKEALENEIIIY